MRCRAIAAMTGAAAVLAGLWPAGCEGLTGFDCSDDDQCQTNGRVGVCIANEACAYPDPDCASGLRYSEHATQSLAGQCTPRGTTSSSGDVGDTSAGSDGPVLTTGSSSAETFGTSSSGGPVCGDGVPEGDEDCDDGNDVPGDGCEPDCRHSPGTLLGGFTSQLAGTDSGLDLAVVGDTIYVVGYAVGPDGSNDILVYAYRFDGTPAWDAPFLRGGAPGTDDRGRAMAYTKEGTLLVAGSIRTDEGASARDQVWVGELDQQGTMLWEAQIGQPSPVHDQAYDVLALDDGSFVVTGRVRESGSSIDFMVGRHAHEGGEVTTLWEQTIDGPAGTGDYGFALALDISGDVLAGGTIHETPSDFDRYLQGFAALDGAPTGCLDDGSDADTVVADGNDQIRGLAVGSDGRIVAAGFGAKNEAEGRDAWIGFYDTVGAGRSACLLSKQDFVAGNGHTDDGAFGVTLADDGSAFVVGYLRGSELDEDIWVARYDPSGDLVWQTTHDGDGSLHDRAHAVAVDPSGEVVVVGHVTRPGDIDLWVGRFAP